MLLPMVISKIIMISIKPQQFKTTKKFIISNELNLAQQFGVKIEQITAYHLKQN